MPVYDYRCRECGRVHEVFLRSAGADPPTCPDCGSERLERLLSTFSVLNPAVGGGATTCCGRDERCDSPPCSTGYTCRRK
jgi:putative FmdB family regulatory protein